MPSVLDARTAAQWELLLQNIARGSVVPIVGRELLSIGGPPETTLYGTIALELAKMLGVPAAIADDATSPLNAVASQHILSGGEVDDIYSGIASILQTLGPVA